VLALVDTPTLLLFSTAALLRRCIVWNSGIKTVTNCTGLKVRQDLTNEICRLIGTCRNSGLVGLSH
jgi:hypothetical protein